MNVSKYKYRHLLLSAALAMSFMTAASSGSHPVYADPVSCEGIDQMPENEEVSAAECLAEPMDLMEGDLQDSMPEENMLQENMLQDNEEQLSAQGAATGCFTAKSGSFTLKTVNTDSGATQTHTVTVTVDKTIDQRVKTQNCKYAVTSSGNWQTVPFSDSKKIFGMKLSDGTKSSYFYTLYDRLNLPKPKGYIVSSAAVSGNYNAASDKYKMGVEVRWDHSNSGGTGNNITSGSYFDQTLLNEYAPVFGQNDQRFSNTYETEGVVKLLLLTSCRNAGLRLDCQESGTKNMTVTLNYTPAEYYVNFDSQGGSACAQAKVKYDNDLYLPTPSKKGYTFTGWSGAGLTQAKGTVKNLTATNQKVLDLTAGWSANSYTVTYDSKGGSSAGATNAAYDRSFVLPTVQRTGYQFLGWSGGGLSGATGTVINLTDKNGGTVSLSAGWSPIKYKIVLRENGGSPCESIDISYDEEAELPTPTREGYEFLGWSGAGLVKKTGKVKNLSVYQDTEVELTAEWEKIPEPEPEPEEDETLKDIDKKLDDLMEKKTDPSTEINEYYNTYGMTSQQAKEWLEYLIGGGSVRLKIDGVDFELVKNDDGTISIKLADMGNVKKVVIPNEITIGEVSYPITSIAAFCFKNNDKVEEVVLGNHVLRIEESAFENCKNLKRITLNDGLVSIGDKAFFGCTSLQQIELKKGIQSIGNSAFEGSGLSGTLKLNEGLLSVGKRAFFGCKALEHLYISASLLQIGDQAFSQCTALKTVTHAPHPELLKLGKQAFMSDKALLRVQIPEKLQLISNKAFFGCSALTRVKGMNAVDRIGDRAFEGCKALKTITLPGKLQQIGKKAFYNCKRLKKVTIRSKILSRVGKQAFVKCSKKLKFQVPKNKGVSYRKLMKGKY